MKRGSETTEAPATSCFYVEASHETGTVAMGLIGLLSLGFQEDSKGQN